jgi:multiple sugar transport system permease protein
MHIPFRRKIIPKFISYSLLIGMLIIALFPVYWMLITSVKPMGDIYSLKQTFWPKNITWSGYSYLFKNTEYVSWLLNSFVVSIISALVTILFSVPAAYGLVRFAFKGRDIIGNSILIAYLLPQTLIFIPIYIMVTRIGLTQSIWGLLLIYPSTTIPYAVWMLTSYFQSIEKDFDDAALIDGCSNFQVMYLIIAPLSAPGIVSTLIFSFTLCWSEYLYALVILSGNTKTLPLGLSTMLFGDVARWNTIMGGAIIATIPIIIIYVLASKYIVSGLALGGVKG